MTFLFTEEHAFRLSDGYEHVYLRIHKHQVIGMLKYQELTEQVEIM